MTSADIIAHANDIECPGCQLRMCLPLELLREAWQPEDCGRCGYLYQYRGRRLDGEDFEILSRPRFVRVQLSRAKGWRKPPNTVVVARPSKWGNPYRLDADHQPWSRFPWLSRERAQACVDYYRRAATEWLCVPYTKVPRPGVGPNAFTYGAHLVAEAAPYELRGKNLACWCALDQPCHADVLLELANGEASPTRNTRDQP